MTNTRTKLICFDLDDTLIDDNWKFETTFCDCLKAVLLGLAAKAPQLDEILKTARDLDNMLLETLPKEQQYTPRRLITAWQETYRKMSEQKEIPIKPHIMQMLEAYIIQNYEPPYLVIAGAVDALIKVREMKNIRMELVTIGDTEIQNRKAKFARLDHYFDHIEVVHGTAGKEAYLKKQVAAYGADNVFMIGNSLRSDINPAINAGAQAIHIPRGSWHVNTTESVSDNYTEVRRMFDLPPVLEKMLTENKS